MGRPQEEIAARIGVDPSLLFTFRNFLEIPKRRGWFERGRPFRVRVFPSACPAREQAPFCVFRTGRQE